MEERRAQGARGPARIVVGGNHIPAGTAALRWAVGEAERTGSSVTVVHVFDPAERLDLLLERQADPDLGKVRRDARYRTYAWVVEALADAGTTVPVLVATPQGPVWEMLAAHAVGADLLGIGEPAGALHRGLPDLLAGSCACPVVTVADDRSLPGVIA
jgi:nucleotide-binding universal stress UspA family protein